MAYWYAHLGVLILLTSPLPISSDPDVPVGVALMDQNPVLVEGYDAELSCRFHGVPRAVYYYKDALGSGLVITWYDNDRIWPGYDSGKYDITDAYSLVIHEVTASDAGRYYCRVSDSRGIIIGNDTDATVQTAPRAPFPTIDQCLTDTESPCSLYVNHSDDAVILTCRAEDASRGLVSLLWSHSGSPEDLQHQKRISANQDGRTETVEAIIKVQNSPDPYVCTAIVHATRFENWTASVTVRVQIVTTTMTATTTTTAVVLPHTPLNTGRQTIIAVLCLLLIVVVIIIIIIVGYVKRETLKSLKCPLFSRPYTAIGENPETEGESLSYIELWWLSCHTELDLHALAAAIRTLRGQPDETHSREKRIQRAPSRRELYGALCAWKEEMEAKEEELRQRHRLGEALKEQKMNKQVTRLEEFRTSNEEISDDDLEYICWSVRELPKRVKPVIKALGFKKQSSTDNYTPAWPIPPRQQERRAEVEENMQSLLKWRVVARGANKMYADENIGSSERVVFAENHFGEEGSLHLTGVKESAAREGLKGRSAASVNQRVAMCRALEQAGKTDPRYRQVAKTFSLHALNDASSKRNPTEEEVKFLAIAINLRHCLKLNEKVKLSPGKCKDLAEENLDVLFRSHGMLEDWLKEQMCSSYEIRCRLRAAAEQAGRKDIADTVIRKESMIDPSEPAQISINQECSTDKTDQPVSYITLEELRWIWRLASKDAIQRVCSHYKIAPEAESTEHGKEADDDLLKKLQAKLNNEYVKKKQKGKGKQSEKMDPRGVVRQILEGLHPSNACLMSKVVEQRFISDVEITELALRIALTDIYDFAEALGISMGRLTDYKPTFKQGNEAKGTFAIVFKLVELAKRNMINTRRDLCRFLRDLGYRQEARMISFGHSVGIGDMIAVAKSEDTSALLRELGVSLSGSNPDVQANPDAQSKPDFQTTVDALRRWRGAIHPPSFNHRMALVEALYRMDNKPLALGILSGKHRKVAITREIAAQLARDIPADDDHMSRLCEALKLKEKKDRKLPSSPEDAIMAWAADEKRHFLETEGKREKKLLELSNSFLRAGFFEVAYEIMAGVTQQQEGNKGRPTNKTSNDSHDIPQSSHENEPALPLNTQVSTEHDEQGKVSPKLTRY